EGFDLFSEMIATLKAEVTERLFKVQVRKEEEVEEIEKRPKPQKMVYGRGGGPEKEPSKPVPVKSAVRAGRNDPCPCGSGKKYKKCCGK
ncbi:MAG: SEC-C domain-containing protein, partial [Deltaproteobacteria bacterium]|nr:SEC-C domain-containing protein [Deltaproteobacteria bacterium]